MTGKASMAAIIGGTASELGGGKFANGAVTAAFVMMYNDMSHPNISSQRKQYIRMKASLISENKNVPEEYRNKIRYLLEKDKILYVERALRRTKLGMENVFGTADPRTNIVRLTSRIWNYHNGDMVMVDRQINRTFLHEVKHLILNTGDHPGGRNHFDDNIKAMGY